MKIGDNLRKIRLERGLKQENMADLLGLSQSGYNKIERNLHDVNQEKLEIFAEKLEIKKEDLLDIDTKYIQENHNNKIEQQHQNQTVHNYNQDLTNELIASYKNQHKLYEEKIAWLEEKVRLLERSK
jgi:transcriptional regulator with XRE-family HTH domain